MLPLGSNGDGRTCAFLAALLHVSVLVGCSNRVCEAPADAVLATIPERLSQTGLYSDIVTAQTAPGVLAYAPRFPLWSDGAEKRRWLSLPEGTRIDTSDADLWQFPQGTKFWKEFTRDGVRVETRLLFKYGAATGDWVGMAYMWSPDQSDATAVPEGAIDARGTPHDIPAAAECFACHGGSASRVLGFSLIQLAYEAGEGNLDIAQAIQLGMLSAPPDAAIALPGDATERAALGYLHANCAHCHNQRRPSDDGLRCFDPHNRLDFWLPAHHLEDARDTPAYQSAIGFVIQPRHPARSRLIDKVSHRPGMPPIATELVDESAVELLRRWIAEMP